MTDCFDVLEPTENFDYEELPAPRKCDRIGHRDMLGALRFDSWGVTCPCCNGDGSHAELRKGIALRGATSDAVTEETWRCTHCEGNGIVGWEEWLDAYADAGGTVAIEHAGPSSRWTSKAQALAAIDQAFSASSETELMEQRDAIAVDIAALLTKKRAVDRLITDRATKRRGK